MKKQVLPLLVIVIGCCLVWARQKPASPGPQSTTGFDQTILENNQRMFADGKKIFRFETFGDEAFWTDTLKIHRAIMGEKAGGIGLGLSPKMAMQAGLKVDIGRAPFRPG
jgi:hypothetical protein